MCPLLPVQLDNYTSTQVINAEYSCVAFFFWFSIDHTGLVTGVRFGRNASFIASVAMDRNLKYFGLQQ